MAVALVIGVVACGDDGPQRAGPPASTTPTATGLAPALATPEQRVGGFHIFTFNDLADTEAWRQRKLAGG